MKAVVIGGGIAGAGITRSLAKRGVGVQLLEKSKNLTAGATWHAAGLVTRFAGSPKLKKLHVQAVTMMLELQEKHDLKGFNVTGSIRLIEKGNKARYLEAKHHHEMAKLYDIEGLGTEIISAEEVGKLHPLVDTSEVECGIWTPKDGDVDPTSLTNLVASLAKKDGAEILLEQEVVGVDRRADGTFLVKSASGREFEGDILINAAGLWSKQISQMLGLGFADHPAYVIEHQYAITETIPAIVEWQAGDPKKRVPVLRDLKGSSYIRQERTGLLIGPYENETAIAELDKNWNLGPPGDFDMELFPDRLDRIEENIMSGIELIPALGEVGFASVVNGPTIWTGDSLPRCGRSKIPGYYDFNTLTYGIAQGLPLSEYLAGIILDGEQPFEMTAQCDPLRYNTWCTPGYVAGKVAETYSHNNKVSYDFENRVGGRDAVPTSKHPIHEVLSFLGAHYTFSFGGVEVPAFFNSDAKPLSEKTVIDHEWIDIAEAEAQHVLEKVGVAYSSFSKILVKGASAEAFLDRLTTNSLPAVGRSRLTYALTPKGRVNAEFTITRLSPEEFYVVGSRDYTCHDVQWMIDRARAESFDVDIKDISDDVDIVHIAGPRSHALMERLLGEPFKLGFMKMEPRQIAGADVNVFRISFTGEFGYELHAPTAAAADVLRAVLAAGEELDIRPFGGYAVNALRVEKGFKLKADLDYAHYTEAGIDMFCKEAKPFLGRGTGAPARQAAIFAVDAAPSFRWSVPSDCPIFCGDELVGFTTSSAFGPRTGKTIVLGYMTKEVAADAKLVVEAYGNLWPTEMLPEPPLKCITAAKGEVASIVLMDPAEGLSQMKAAA